jgi:antitoxin (DNA-binding transcriptional repressor) of toxin-antitoxin stability system
MSNVVTIEHAQTNLRELIDHLAPGDEVVITRDQTPIAKLVSQKALSRQPRKPGSAKGKLTILAEDDDHLKDFEEYTR